MNELIGKSICLIGKSDNEKTKCEAYKINTIKLEFENDKMNRVNFHLVPNYYFLKELNVKLCTKDKDVQTVFKELSSKTRTTLSENSFLKEAINVLKQIDKKIEINITPIIYNEKQLIFHIKIGELVNCYEWNEAIKTIELLNKWNLYKDNKNAIDFYLNCNLKYKESKNLSKLLFDNKEKVTMDIVKKAAEELTVEEKNKMYQILDNLVSEETKQQCMKYYKYYKLFKKRISYIKIYNELERDKINKYLMNKWLKNEFGHTLIVDDPSNFDMVFKYQFNDVEENKKNYIVKLENEFKKFWNHFENGINKKLDDFKVALCRFDFLLERLEVKAIGNNKMKSYVLNISDLNKEIDNMILDFSEDCE